MERYLSAYPRRIHSQPASCNSTQNSQIVIEFQPPGPASYELQGKRLKRGSESTAPSFKTRQKTRKRVPEPASDEIAAVASCFGLAQTDRWRRGRRQDLLRTANKLQPDAHRSIGQSYLASSLDGRPRPKRRQERPRESERGRRRTHTPPPLPLPFSL
ncbi:hypothetical protein M440DRAFT_1123127 [Trichoderma longibrachiatum ATCC 18648]|uniref:Uncharacterized protein n=1 Tax=Trichoderma longibrachiatum ATCC 18648 TaxID=983965 RepID=A0A2T4CFM4_TRILO|nr:hypothetical protein M440DRAFT_1123127 [Trichoderma longibrachiatum ATCC 18648]